MKILHQRNNGELCLVKYFLFCSLTLLSIQGMWHRESLCYRYSAMASKAIRGICLSRFISLFINSLNTWEKNSPQLELFHGYYFSQCFSVNSLQFGFNRCRNLGRLVSILIKSLWSSKFSLILNFRSYIYKKFEPRGNPNQNRFLWNSVINLL